MAKRKIILDTLRGIAGLCVVLFHLSEPFGCYRAGAPRVEQVCGHGYLAVEFFLLLMGYMLGYAYDRRWQEGMGFGSFCLRRLKRLHPCVISGLVIGMIVVFALSFCSEPIVGWWRTTSAGTVGWYVGAGVLMIPAFGASMLAPFNACSWTLYYEYLGNLLYALFVRRLGVKMLGMLAALSLIYSCLFVFSTENYAGIGPAMPTWAKYCALEGGWGMNGWHATAGTVRLFFPFFFGLLLFRLGLKIALPKRFALPVSVAIFLAVLFTPYSYKLGYPAHPWINGLFDLAAVGLVFPLLILIGVGSETPDGGEGRISWISVFFAELSYPLYMSHYPFMFVHNWWVRTKTVNLSTTTVICVCVAEFVFYVVLSIGVMTLLNRLTAPKRSEACSIGKQ